MPCLDAQDSHSPAYLHAVLQIHALHSSTTQPSVSGSWQMLDASTASSQSPRVPAGGAIAAEERLCAELAAWWGAGGAYKEGRRDSRQDHGEGGNGHNKVDPDDAVPGGVQLHRPHLPHDLQVVLFLLHQPQSQSQSHQDASPAASCLILMGTAAPSSIHSPLVVDGECSGNGMLDVCLPRLLARAWDDSSLLVIQRKEGKRTLRAPSTVEIWRS